MPIERIFLAGEPGGPQVEVPSIGVIVNAGISGDRYFGAREFRIGSVSLRGVELCEPCMGFGERIATADFPAAAVVRRFVHRAGIRADILGSGVIAVGADVADAP